MDDNIRRGRHARRAGAAPEGQKCYDDLGSAETATMPANHSMKSDGPSDKQETGRVLRFEPRARRPRAPLSPFGASPVKDVGKYARGADDGEDYRHRMRANVAAFVVVGLLIWCGYWLFDTLSEMRKNQDCVLSGRTNCMRIEVPAVAR
jgi:hypothetical protein